MALAGAILGPSVVPVIGCITSLAGREEYMRTCIIRRHEHMGARKGLILISPQAEVLKSLALLTIDSFVKEAAVELSSAAPFCLNKISRGRAEDRDRDQYMPITLIYSTHPEVLRVVELALVLPH